MKRPHAPGEQRTVQAHIRKCAQEIGWTYVLRAETEAWCGIDATGATKEEWARKADSRFDGEF